MPYRFPFFLFFGAVLLFGCTEPDPAVPAFNPPTSNPNPNPGPANGLDTFSYLALGDSYTIGASVEPEARYPNQLAAELEDLGIALSPVDIVARTGWTTNELDNGINQRQDLAAAYDLVSLLIGVNNQFRGYSIENYAVEFEALLDRAIAFADDRQDRVFVVSIPDYAYTPYGAGSTDISAGIDAFNAVNAGICQDRGIRYFNITPISRRGLAEPGLVAGDGLHPSGEQYAGWVDLMLTGVYEMLEE